MTGSAGGSGDTLQHGRSGVKATLRDCGAAVFFLLLIGLPAETAAAPNPHNTTKCLLCHKETPRFGVDTRETVTFRGGRTSDDPALCSFCHKAEENLHPVLVEPGPDMLSTESPSLLPLGESGELKGKVV